MGDDNNYGYTIHAQSINNSIMYSNQNIFRNNGIIALCMYIAIKLFLEN